MSDLEFAAAVRAARAKAPKGMGDFALREIVRAALDAVAAVRDPGRPVPPHGSGPGGPVFPHGVDR